CVRRSTRSASIAAWGEVTYRGLQQERDHQLTKHYAVNCSCERERELALAALAQRTGLSRRALLRSAAGVGAVVALAGALPTWADTSGADDAGSWLAGDLHCHTALSHDVWGGPRGDNTDTPDAYTYGW